MKCQVNKGDHPIFQPNRFLDSWGHWCWFWGPIFLQNAFLFVIWLLTLVVSLSMGCICKWKKIWTLGNSFFSNSLLEFTEKTIFGLGKKYEHYDPEFLVANCAVYSIFIFGALVVYLAVNPKFKRVEKPVKESNEGIPNYGSA